MTVGRAPWFDGLTLAGHATLSEECANIEKPDGWPDKCGSCGASWEHIGFDYADGFNCRACGRCDSDE